jgi:hypothetical protein
MMPSFMGQRGELTLAFAIEKCRCYVALTEPPVGSAVDSFVFVSQPDAKHR